MGGEARGNGVDADALVGHLEGRAARQRHHAGLGGRVVALAALGPPAEHARVVDDGPAAALDHVGQHGARHAEDAVERHVDDAEPVLVLHVDDITGAAETGVVDDDVQVAERVDGGGGERPHLLVRRHVAERVADLGAGDLGERPGGLGGAPLVDVAQEDARPLLDTALRGRKADARTGRCGDQYVLALEEAVALDVGRRRLAHRWIPRRVPAWLAVRRDAARAAGRARAR